MMIGISRPLLLHGRRRVRDDYQQLPHHRPGAVSTTSAILS